MKDRSKREDAKHRDTPHRYKRSDKIVLSSDARIVLALMKNQPLEIKELAKVARVHPATVSRNIRLLINEKVLKKTPKGYALWNYTEVERSLRLTLQKLKNGKYTAVSLKRLSDETNLSPTDENLLKLAYYLASEYGLKIREKG